MHDLNEQTRIDGNERAFNICRGKKNSLSSTPVIVGGPLSVGVPSCQGLQNVASFHSHGVEGVAFPSLDDTLVAREQKLELFCIGSSKKEGGGFISCFNQGPGLPLPFGGEIKSPILRQIFGERQ